MKEAKKLGFSVEQVVMADLISLGYSEADAYLVAYQGATPLNDKILRREREKVLSSTKFKLFCDDRKQTNASRLKFSGDLSNVELIDNEQTAREILKIARQMPENSKERGEMFMKYADLTRKNDQKTEDTTEAINFYFPVKCHQCPLLHEYNNYIKECKEKDPNYKLTELRPVEMEAIIRRAIPFIENATKKSGA